MVHHRGSPLVVVGGCAGRHGELILGNTLVVLVDGGFMRKWVGFSDQAGKSVGGGIDTVHQGSGQGCRRVGGIVSCRCAWRVGLEKVLAHRNAGARSARSGGSVASDRLGRGGVLSGARAILVRGIDPLGQGGSGGEVMARSAVGGVLARHGVHQWQWRWRWRHGVLELCLCKMGSGFGC
jgi:hypothetical protein